MPLSRKIECISCEAMYTLQHQLDLKYYTAKYCAFCSEELEFIDELEDTLDEDEEAE